MQSMVSPFRLQVSALVIYARYWWTIFCVSTAFAAPSTLSSIPRSAQQNLDRALHFADLDNWYSAHPFFQLAEKQFKAAGDERNAFYAHWGAIRAALDAEPISRISYRLGQELATNPLLRSDKALRLFCAAIKGDFDGEIDASAMRSDWTEVLTLAKELRDKKWQYRAQAQLGFADFYEGDLPGAQRNVSAALIGAAEINDIGGQIFFLSALATGYQGQGLYDPAIAFADRAIVLSRRTPDTRFPLIAIQVRFRALIATGRLDLAEAELRAMMGRKELRNNFGHTTVLILARAEIAQAKNQLGRAIADLEIARRRASTSKRMLVLIDTDTRLADLYRKTGNLPKAEQAAQEAAASAQAAGNIPAVPQLLHVLAQLQIAQGRYREADRTYNRAAAIQDIMIGRADSVIGKTALIKGASDLYAKHFALIAEHIHNPAEAFAVIEQARGRVMTDLLLSGRTTSPESIETEKKVALLRLKLMAARSDAEVRRLRDEIFLVEQSRSITPAISILSQKGHIAITPGALQEALAPSEALLEYVLDEPASFCLVITHDSIKVHRLNGKSVISTDVRAFLREVKAKHPADAEARRLYRELVETLPEINGRSNLIVVRDGPLHLLPFDALKNGGGDFLVESKVITYAPSATSFYLLRCGNDSTRIAKSVLAVGGVPYGRSGLKSTFVTRGGQPEGGDLPDLPSSEDEARVAVSTLSSPSNRLLLGRSATEAAFKRSVDHGIIHLAVHGIANEMRPEHAALVFLSDPAQGEDGFLQPSEIVQLPLRADLVVLSACDTAVGALEGQEGVANLSSAFLLAGARTVVSTVWSLDDDSTLYLMKVFYNEIGAGRDAAVALAHAKRTMLAKLGDGNALPYYWAAFTTEGFVPRRAQP